MVQSTCIDKVTASLHTARVLAEDGACCGSTAGLWLIVVVEHNLTDLAAIKMASLLAGLAGPPIAGGGHDEFEAIAPDFERGPETWPDICHSELDRYVYETGMTPAEVIVAGWGSCERFDGDWKDLYAAASLPRLQSAHEDDGKT